MPQKKEAHQYEENHLYEIEIVKIKMDSNQPRKFIDTDQLEGLTASILDKGILQPLLARYDGGKITLVAGERRLRAAQDAGLEKVPVLFVSGDTAEISLIENLQRADLNPIEEAESVARLVEQKGYKDKDLIPILGKAKSTISEIKKLNELPEEIKKECRDSSAWSRTALLEIARQGNEKEMKKLFQRMKKKIQLGSSSLLPVRKGSKHREKTEIAFSKIDGLKKLLDGMDHARFDKTQKKKIEDALTILKEKIDDLLQQFGAPNS